MIEIPGQTGNLLCLFSYAQSQPIAFC